MSFTHDWDDSYESEFSNDNYGHEIDDKVNKLINMIRERMEVDHEWKNEQQDGKHKKLTLVKQTSIGTPDTGEAKIGLLEINSVLQAVIKNPDADELRLIMLPSGTKMYFYENTAPLGWTIDSSCADALLAVKGGSNAYKADGGNQAGTWTQPNHTHTGPSHTHTGPEHYHEFDSVSTGSNVIKTGDRIGWATAVVDEIYQMTTTGGTAVGKYLKSQTASAGTGDTGAGGTGATSANATANTWRPLAQVGIICTKD